MKRSAFSNQTSSPSVPFFWVLGRNRVVWPTCNKSKVNYSTARNKTCSFNDAQNNSSQWHIRTEFSSAIHRVTWTSRKNSPWELSNSTAARRCVQSKISPTIPVLWHEDQMRKWKRFTELHLMSDVHCVFSFSCWLHWSMRLSQTPTPHLSIMCWNAAFVLATTTIDVERKRQVEYLFLWVPCGVYSVPAEWVPAAAADAAAENWLVPRNSAFYRFHNCLKSSCHSRTTRACVLCRNKVLCTVYTCPSSALPPCPVRLWTHQSQHTASSTFWRRNFDSFLSDQTMLLDTSQHKTTPLPTIVGEENHRKKTLSHQPLQKVHLGVLMHSSTLCASTLSNGSTNVVVSSEKTETSQD